MKRRLRIAILISVLGLSSCNLPGSRTTETPLSSPIVDTPTPGSSTPTPIPIETLLTIESPTRIPTSTPSVFLASPKDQPVNCRFGPGTSYAVIGALNIGRQAEIIGKNIDSTWWYVRNPSDPSTSCWLSAEFIQMVGDVESLPVVRPPDIMVTSINVSIEPVAMNVACDAFPQIVIITAYITATGPSTVVWRWQSSTGQVSSEKNLLFEEGGTKTVQDYYQVNSANDYSIEVQTSLPNIVTGRTTFKVICTP